MRVIRFHIVLSVCLVQLLATAMAPAEELVESKPFVYTDDWALVSAPPPPGPYNAVNIDPRVPGQDAVPPIPMVEPPSMTPMPDLPMPDDTPPPAAVMPADTKTDIPEAAPFRVHRPPAGRVPSVTGDDGQEIPTDIPEAAPFPEYPPPASGAPVSAGHYGRAAPADRPMPVPGYQRPAGNPPSVTGSYGRGIPGRRPAYDYPVPGMYSAPTGYPGYRAIPSEGFYGGNRYRPVDEVPPPPVYDAMTGRP
jgi:hypothetical protein